MNLDCSHRTAWLIGILFAAVIAYPPALFAQRDSGAEPPGWSMRIIHASSQGVSAPLHDTALPPLPEQAANHFPLDTLPAAPGGGGGGGGKKSGGGGGGGKKDPALQTDYPSLLLPRPLVSFDGIASTGGAPPDPNLAVGPDQVVEIVNGRFAVYHKNGQTVQAPVPIKTIFQTMTGRPCGDFSGGDPIVLYDQIDGRWLISELLFFGFTDPRSSYLCVAVSQNSDATGSYNLYDYAFALANLPDYPKFGIWPDAYYMSANTFIDGRFTGAIACALDRNAMLVGSAAAMICFQGDTTPHSLLPASLDGSTPPPARAPNYFLQLDSDALTLYKFHADFGTPAQTTFLGPVSIPIATFQQAGFVNVVPQPDVDDRLEAIGDRLMYRLSYRNFGHYESLLVNHTVQVALNGPANTQTGIRWYEIRDPGGVPTVSQQSTFSPDTTTWRWMGSIGQDKMGNMLLGYTASSPDLFPSIRYTAHWAGLDELNQMEQEGEIQRGAGSQVPNPNGNGRNRWGDYTSVAVDPMDDCTLWFVSEYLPNTGYGNWVTRLASFKFDNCRVDP